MLSKWLIVCLALVTAACESPVTPVAPLPTAADPVDTAIRVPIGQSVQVTVGLNGALRSPDPVGLTGLADYRYELVHVMFSEPMTAIVRVVSDQETDARHAEWRVLNWPCCTLKWQSIHQVVVTTAAPTDLVLELYIPVNGPAETFTISASRVEP